eukprot:1122822-Rhodomonas_salina.1
MEGEESGVALRQQRCHPPRHSLHLLQHLRTLHPRTPLSSALRITERASSGKHQVVVGGLGRRAGGGRGRGRDEAGHVGEGGVRRAQRPSLPLPLQGCGRELVLEGGGAAVGVGEAEVGTREALL